MKNKIKALLFLPLAFLALGMISLAGKYFNSSQQKNLLIETAHADAPVPVNFMVNMGNGGCVAAAACAGCCCGCCCGC